MTTPTGSSTSPSNELPQTGSDASAILGGLGVALLGIGAVVALRSLPRRWRS